MRFAERFPDRSLGRNAAVMFVGQGLTFFTQAAYFLLLARLLRSQEYGIFVGAAALASIASQYSSLGSGWVLLRHVSQDRLVFPQYWGNSILTTLAIGSLIVILLQLIGKWIIGPSGAAILVLIAVGECIFARLTECAGQAFQAFEHFRWTATLTTLTSVARLLAAAIMTVTWHHVTVKQWAVAWLAVSAATSLIAIGVVFMRIGKPVLRPRLLGSTVSEGIAFAFASSTTVVYNDVDKTMLSHYGMTTANGIYSMAYRIIDMSCVPIRSLHSAALPRFFKLGSAGARGNIRVAGQVLGKTFPYALLAGVLMYACAGFIPMVAGSSFAGSVTVLRWLALLPALRSLHLSAGDALTGGGYQRYRTISQVFAAALNFCLNLYLIPAFSWRGAASSSLATDGILAVVNWMLLSFVIRREERNLSLSVSNVDESELVTVR
jgi:O-antigen/teichoic acid export membrane protein